MRLSAYIAESGKTIAVVAVELGELHETVRLWANGRRFPRQAALAKIALWSGGRVTANDFVRVPTNVDAPLPAEGVA